MQNGGKISAASSFILALGSNVGDRPFNLNRACRSIERGPVRILARSRLYISKPWPLADPPNPGLWYLNAAILVAAPISPLEMLDRCLAAEREIGRIRRERWEPRIIDIDVVHWSGGAFSHPRLEIPHPRRDERDFVLAPMIDLGVPGLAPLLAHADRCIETSRRWP